MPVRFQNTLNVRKRIFSYEGGKSFTQMTKYFAFLNYTHVPGQEANKKHIQDKSIDKSNTIFPQFTSGCSFQEQYVAHPVTNTDWWGLERDPFLLLSPPCGILFSQG